MTAGSKAKRLTRFSLTTANADRLSAFYEQALGCKRIGVTELRGAGFDDLLAIRGGARCITLGVGEEIIELLEFEHPGAPYPTPNSASDLTFQHFAIVVADMTEAWFRLSRIPGWSPITHGLPQRLPESSGGVTAFKFRDPEGHPLEFLSFPADKFPERWSNSSPRQTCQGIDHSAVSVASAPISTEFYETLGLSATGQSLNAGPEQNALDGISSVRVEVVTLLPERHTPHVELLCYGSAASSRNGPCRSNDIACTRLVFEGTAQAAQRISDPDGHHLILLSDTQLRRPYL
jgi:catechol 2,3-dioxygenase-like lactoylglutathione lyase family enzyme